jgi:hypothetical protein
MPGLFIFAIGIIVGVGASGSSFSLLLATVGRILPLMSKKQALVIGLVTSFASIGQGTCLPLFELIIERLSWK